MGQLWCEASWLRSGIISSTLEPPVINGSSENSIEAGSSANLQYSDTQYSTPFKKSVL